MSHVVTIEVAYKDEAVLSDAVKELGGEVLGAGVHKLFSGSVEGFGFRLPGWRYPLVLQVSGKLAYDDYGGHWGNVKDLDRLKQAYAGRLAVKAAVKQGWRLLGQSKKQDGTVVYRVGR